MQKVVVLTGRADEGILQRCRDLGADQIFRQERGHRQPG
jgi:3-deoxy-D-manno-octulosonate 8-phosphate phosphatase KdsC-like HAD superfamily phosphatase